MVGGESIAGLEEGITDRAVGGIGNKRGAIAMGKIGFAISYL